MTHRDVVLVTDFDGAEGVVGSKIQCCKGHEQTTATCGPPGKVVDDVRGMVSIAEGLFEAEVHPIVEVDEF